MRITQETFKLKIVTYFILLCIACGAGTAIVDQNIRLFYLIIGVLILMMGTYIISKIGLFLLFCILIFIYWIPLDSRLQAFSQSLSCLYPTELGIWMLFLGILIQSSVSPNTQWNSAVSRFPFLPFLLFIGGALITYLVTEHYSNYPLVKIRTFCILPAPFCFLCIYLIKTVKQAERLLWIFLISAGLCGLVYLYAPQIADPYIFSEFGEMEKSDRIRRIIMLPFLGILEMGPETTPVCFAFIIALSLNLWLNHPSFWGRSVAAGILAISILVIVMSQGRTGLIAAVSSVVVIMTLTLIFRKHSLSLLTKGLLKAGIVIISILIGVWHYASISTSESLRFRLSTEPLGLEDRIWRWKESANVFFKHPFGIGFGGFPTNLESSGSAWFAHNLYLYLLLSAGVIGFIGFLWIFVRYTKACWSGLHSDNLNRQILCIGGIGCATALFVAGLTSCVYAYPWQILMVWIPIGITMAAATLKDKV